MEFDLNKTDYLSQIKEMQERDEKHLENSKNNQDSILYSSFKTGGMKIDFPLFEPRTAFTTPIKYFQNLYINQEKWPFVWRHDSTRAIGITKNHIYLLSKHLYPEEKVFSHYLFLKLNKKEIHITIDETNSIQISFEGEKEVYNLKTGEKENIHIQFNFIQKPFHKTQKHRAQHTAMYKNTYRGKNITQAASKFEDYTVTVSHFSPHPYLLNDFKKLRFEKRSEMQKSVFDYLKEKI